MGDKNIHEIINNTLYKPAAAADVGDKLDRAETQNRSIRNASLNSTLLR